MSIGGNYWTSSKIEQSSTYSVNMNFIALTLRLEKYFCIFISV